MKRAIVAVALLLQLLGSVALAADAYPVRPVHFIVPFAAGGATDVLARQFADRMSRGLAQPIVVDNVPGAGGTLGATKVAKSEPDGYTFLVGHVGYMAAAVGLYNKLAYDPVQDFEAVCRFPDTPLVLIVGRESGLTDIQTVVARAKREPGKLNFGNAGVGSTGHLVAALFASAAGIELTSVSYKGNAPALTDVMSGQVHGMFDQSNTALPQVRGQRVRAIGITSRQRLPQFPDVPTLEEAGLAGFEAATWYGIYAPRGTPRPIIEKMHAQFLAAMQDTAFTSKLAEEGYQLLPANLTAPEALAAHTKSEVARWKRVISDAKIPAL